MWPIVIVTLLGMLLVGVFAYNSGFSHGAVQIAQTASQGTATPAPYPYAWGWYRPWGFGLFPLLIFFFFWIFISRIFWWGGPWRRGWYGCGYGPYGYGHPYWYGRSRERDNPDAFDEWHREAHDRMKEKKPADDPGDRR
jgi:hypothetical protein